MCRGAQLSVHLLHSGGDQAITALLVLILGGLCARHWRITLAIIAALLIGAALIALSVIADFYMVREITGYLHRLGHLIG